MSRNVVSKFKHNFNGQNIEKLSQGSYGIIYKGNFTGVTGANQVVKRNIIDVTTSFSGSIREMDVLVTLHGHPNIIKLESVMLGFPCKEGLLSPLSVDEYKDDLIHFVFETATCDLAQLISRERLTYHEIRYLICDILVGCEYMHISGYFHRDLKTPNLLVFPAELGKIGRRHIKICDFGLSKPYCQSGLNTPKVVTGWYRAPDVCSGSTSYGCEIDSWSIGCIFYELLTREPLCNGCDDDDLILMTKICTKIPVDCFIPKPDIKILESLVQGIPYDIFTEQLRFRNTLEAECGTTSKKHIIDILTGLLKVSPEGRISPTKALESPFFDPIRHEFEPLRQSYLAKIKNLKDEMYFITDCPERKVTTNIAFNIFNLRTQFFWYKHRILFQAVSLMDRYLKWKKDNNHDKPHSEDGTILRFLVCIYASFKFFTTIDVTIIPFEEFATENYRNSESVTFAEQFERLLIEKILKYKFYLPTPFEVISETLGKKLTEAETCRILSKYGQMTTFEGTISRLSSICED